MSAERPNILLIHCHDLGQYIGCYGLRTVQTPNLDAFAAAGVRFANSFCTSPTCSPSRASLFTGRYPHSNGVMGLCHASFDWDLNPEERHLAQILGQAGYATSAVGVLHETRSGPGRCGYQDYDPASWGFASQAVGAAIERFKRFRAGPARPFFLSVGIFEPHRVPAPHTDPPGEHGFVTPEFTPDESLGVQIPGYLRDTPGVRQELAGLQGAVQYVDAQFGRLVAAVRDLGLEANTLIIFTADHGVAMPRAKASLYDPGIAVSLLLRLPSRSGWHGGLAPASLVLNIDLLPTLLDMIGLPVPPGVQGRSFAPLLDGGAYTPRQEIFAEMTYHDYYDPRRCIRTEEHKLIANFTTAPFYMDPSQRWRPLADTTSPANRAGAYHPHVELYDIRHDAWELANLSGNPEHDQTQRHLLRRLRRHLEETQDPILRGAILSPHHQKAIEYLSEA